ncbi:MAG: Txe/YoeB family addiction module toxin [Bacteroidia bacterium]|nr:MAG: Txe/YoeB family addiction module toxin [Bacteroidia bacterium]
MRFVFNSDSWEEYLHWQSTNRKMTGKINALLEDISRHPFTGLGKPELLKHDLAGFWSRRIDQEHRLVYRVTDDEIRVYSCKFHYD